MIGEKKTSAGNLSAENGKIAKERRQTGSNMKEKLPNLLMKKPLLPVLGALLGILLIVFGGVLPNTVRRENREEAYEEVNFYTDMLEKKIESLCTSIAGVTEAKVLLTLDCGTESVYAENEQQSAGDSYRTDYLLVNDGEGEGALLVMEIYPKIRGVAVVCTGGNEGTVRQTVIELLSAALGIPTNRVKVAGS